jgi:hypothetical protein
LNYFAIYSCQILKEDRIKKSSSFIFQEKIEENKLSFLLLKNFRQQNDQLEKKKEEKEEK